MKRNLLLYLVVAGLLCSQNSFSQCGNPGNDGDATLTSSPNTYYPGITALVSPGSVNIDLGTAVGNTPIAAGDIVLIIQMQAGEINYFNNDRYGDDLSGGYGNGVIDNVEYRAGLLEYGVAQNAVSLSGGQLTLASGTIYSYANADYSFQGQRRYQVIRVPQYRNILLGQNIQPPSWNGTTGGVLALQASKSFGFNGFTVDASAAGFRGGGGRQLAGDTGGVIPQYVRPAISPFHGSKGEGTVGTPQYVNNKGALLNTTHEGYPLGSMGMGAPGNAGGGACDNSPGSNTGNSGGGGGANGGQGGKGGNTWELNNPYGGEPGAAFLVTSAKRLAMGGGGGAGSTNDGTGVPGSGFASSGAAGGGIVILSATTFLDAGTVKADGDSANNSVTIDGSGGGGAGGSVLIIGSLGTQNIAVSANGGNGGSNVPQHGGPEGPGGGGGGGVIYATNSLASVSVKGGLPGTTDGNINYGAANGDPGIIDASVMVSDKVPDFYVACALQVPIRLLSFSASLNNNTVLLKWSTSSESNSKHFEVERSADFEVWHTIGTIPASGNSSTTKNYEMTDALPLSGRSYYRLKMVDLNGDYFYSSTSFVDFYGADAILKVYPNPNSGQFIVYVGKPLSNSAVLRIISSTGQVVYQRKVGNLQTFGVNSAKLSRGVYTAVIDDGTGTIMNKFLIQ